MFHLAADHGYTKALYNLGVMYAYGDGVPQDCAKARKLLSEYLHRATGQLNNSLSCDGAHLFCQNDVITKLRNQYFELARREADWTARYGPNHHLAVVNIRNQMRELQQSIRNEMKRELRAMAETYKPDNEIVTQPCGND